eukprot:scaffold19258_cov154-Isochrysis_galbana.AAC.3
MFKLTNSKKACHAVQPVFGAKHIHSGRVEFTKECARCGSVPEAFPNNVAANLSESGESDVCLS